MRYPKTHAIARVPTSWPAGPGYTNFGPGRRPGTITFPEVRDDSLLVRLSKVRNLSLLTLSETPRTRLFIGVNADGLVGLHFVAFSRAGDERYLSVARLPYLRKKTPRQPN